jgi:tRNA(Arg) A34 adenosine deaminase TadA
MTTADASVIASPEDVHHLREAIGLARAARAAGNHPFGAVVVAGGVVVARGLNTVVVDGDATGHAEMNALRASARTPAERLAAATLYASTEPCVMCTGATYWAGIGRLVYGCSSGTLAQLAGDSLLLPCRSILAVAARPTVVVGPLLEDEAAAAHAGFWR